jgi:hypothetical protein
LKTTHTPREPLIENTQEKLNDIRGRVVKIEAKVDLIWEFIIMKGDKSQEEFIKTHGINSR